jgi:hypothetical protein
MGKFLFATLLFSACAAPALAGDVGVSISIGQPGFYGQIDIGNVPRPQVVYAQPVVIQRVPEYASAPPIYLHVPPGHEKHWRKHCAQYNACGRPVFFVRDDWYNNEYVPRYRHRDDERHGDERRGGDEHGHGRGHDKGHDHDDRHDRDR